VQLHEVEVKTGEEEEEVIYSQRSKCLVFGETLLDKGTGNKTWIERGIGDVKLLKHRENGRIRCLMRQEKTLKIVVNHSVDPSITFESNAGNDKSWIWNAHDFSDGESLVYTIFALRFKDKEKADNFKKEYTKAQGEMESLLAGKDAANTEAGDEAAEALAGASLGDKKE
jgi:Ran-binding protein 1